jgi:hypothetical protein
MIAQATVSFSYLIPANDYQEFAGVHQRSAQVEQQRW